MKRYSHGSGQVVKYKDYTLNVAEDRDLIYVNTDFPSVTNTDF